MTTPHIFIATPILGAPEAQFSTSLLNASIAVPRAGVHVTIKQITNESLITRARNSLVHSFLKSDATHLLFIDSDIDFAPDAILKLLSHGKKVVGGTYPKKRIDWEGVHAAAMRGVPPNELAIYGGEMVINLKSEDVESGGVDAVGDLIEVLDVPTGFLLIERSVFEEMALQMPELLIISNAADTRGQPMFGFFCEEIEASTKILLSEDYAFSRRCQRMGIPCYVDASIRLGHNGRYRYVGDVETLFESTTTPVVQMSGADADSENLDVEANPDGRIEKLHIARYEWSCDRIAEFGVSANCDIANGASGSGYGSRILQKHFPKANIVGFDLDERALATSRERSPDLLFIKHDISDFTFRDFDVLVSLETIEHLEDPWSWLRNLKCSWLAMSTPIIPTMARNPFHKHDISKKEMDAALKTAGFKILKYQQQCNDVGMWFCEKVA